MEFKEAYKQLNQRQQEAVDAINGAVLVIAGPGTGKTQLLSVRVANILNVSDSLPENILCLTFTNKAAANMQSRLSRMVGPAAQRVMIKTFHSFAAEIMSLYPDYFWNGARLSNVPDAVQLEIITDILSSLPLDNPLALKFAGQFTSVRDVQEGLRLSKEAGLTPDKLKALIDLNMAYIDEVEPLLVDICAERLTYNRLDEVAMQLDELPEQETDALTRPLISLSTVIKESFETAHTADEGTSKTKHVSAWKTRWIKGIEGVKGMHEERKRNAWWRALADVYDAYRNALHARGYYDYSDMIIEVITQLEHNPSMLADIQERFHYVLIDEFQDTNAAQLRLSHLVADHPSAEGNPNIMAVGDDDQSIYKFNGAELSNMLGFTRTYPKAKVVVLTDNYRSTQKLLDFSAQVIEQASERVTTKQADIVKQLKAVTGRTEDGFIEHIAHPTNEHEYVQLAEQIASLHRGGTSIAVLARSHESLRAATHALQQTGVPVRYEQQQSIFEQPLVEQVMLVSEIATALSTGDMPSVNASLPKLLSHEAWGVDAQDAWKLALQNRVNPQWIDAMAESGNQQLQTIAHWLLWLSAQSQHMPLGRMLEYIIGLSASEHLTSPLRHYFLETNKIDTPYLAGISGIRKLLGLAQEFSLHGRARLSDLVRLMEVSRENNRTITDESLFVTDAHAVELLTVHKAKGLEFDTVFIIDAMESNWKPSSNGRRPPSNLPLRPSGDTYDDYVRLMFVAVTRAKTNVSIHSFYATDSGEEALPSSIIRDILPAKKLVTTRAESLRALEVSLSWPRLEGSKEAALLSGILDSYSLSPSGFLDFLDVAKGGPHYFLEKHLLKLPEAQSTAAAFGNAVHAALERAQQLVIDGTLELALVLTEFEAALHRQNLSEVDFERFNDHGQKTLERLFNTYKFELSQNGKPEVKLTVPVAGAILTGKLDRVDQIGDRLVITDYKTGSPLSSFTTRNKLLTLKAWRHRTQLELYALMSAASGQFKGTKTIEGHMLYVEAESEKDLMRSHIPDQAALTRLEKLVGTVHHKITSLNLPDVRHYDASYDGIVRFEEDLLNGNI